MQKVDRKTHRERKHRRQFLLAAAFVLLAASVTAAVMLARAPEKLPEREQHWGMLVDREAEELVSVTVQQRGKEPWTLFRTAEGRMIPGNDDEDEWTVSEQQGTLLEETMTQLRYEDILTDDPSVYRNNPGDFGLDDPMVTVTALYTDGSRICIHVGNDTGLDGEWNYMTVEGDDRLYAIASLVVEDLNMEYDILRPVPRPEIYAALLDRVTIRGKDGETIAEWKLDGSITDRDAGSRWAVTAPFFCPMDEEALQNLKKSAENLRLGVYTAPATPENLEKYGLVNPERTLVFHMSAGNTGTVTEDGVYDVVEHEERTVTFLVGDARDELADYVRFGDEIFTVSHFTLSAFTDPSPMDTVARYPVLTPLASLESLTVEENGTVLEYVIREKEPQASPEGEAEGETERECLLNGEEISYESFEAAYDRLLTVTFSGTLPQGAAWKEPYKKYTFRTQSGGTHTVELSNWDGMHDAVTVDGATLFYLIRGGMTQLPGESR